jgi:sec-independent protein translocase protein TatC
VDEVDEQRMTLVEHLAELRSRLIKAIVAVMIGMLVAWFAYDWILDILLQPYCDSMSGSGFQLATEAGEKATGCVLIVTDPLEAFTTRLRIAGYGGIALAMPVILWQLWRFVTPGLYPHERKYAIPFVVSALFLFFLGAGLAYWTLPKALAFFQTIGGPNLVEFYAPGPYLRLIVYLMLAFGIGFEFPILLIFLELAGILSYRDLVRFRRFAIVGIVVLVAVITPSGDPFSLFVLSVPMYLFYEVAILFGWLRDRRQRRAGVDADHG